MFFSLFPMFTIYYSLKTGTGEIVGKSCDVILENLKISQSNGTNLHFNSYDTNNAWLLDKSNTLHFWESGAFSVFTPGDGYQDIWGNDYDNTAFLNTVEFVWSF